MDRGERDRELSPLLPGDLRDGEWLTLTVQVGTTTTRLPARARELGDCMSLSLSERDWCHLRGFAGRCGSTEESHDAKPADKLLHPPSGVTAIVRGRVFVLTAEACLAKMISTTLASAGFDAQVETSAEELLVRVQQQPTNVVILEGLGPDSSLAFLSQKLQSIAQLHRPSILALVDSSSPIDGAKALKSGADDFLLTPFRRQELLARVTSLLHRAQTSGELIGAA